MSDPIEIGGKGSSPGPKIVKRMSQLELSTADLYTKRTDIYDSKLLPGVKEAANQLSFPIPDDKKRFIKEVGKVKEKGTDDELDSAKKALTTKQAGLEQPTVGVAVAVAVPIVAKLATAVTSAIVSAAVTYDLAKQVDGLVKNARGDKDKKEDKGVSGADKARQKGEPREKHKINKGKSLPTKGEANSSEDKLNPDGTVKQRRYYGPDGKAQEDIDFNHTDDGTHSFPHRHLWDWNKVPPRQDSR